MAVTKIRKISSWVLILSVVISVVVFCIFFFGGDDEMYKGEYWTPTYTGLLLNWMYILLGVAVAAMLLFGITQFASNFKHNPRGGIMGLGVIVAFFALLYITYAIGGTTPLHIVNSEAQAYNVPFWLKISDMWLYSTYTLVALVVLAIAAGSVKKMLSK